MTAPVTTERSGRPASAPDGSERKRPPLVPSGTAMGGIAGAVGLLVVWQIVGLTMYQSTHVIPTPVSVARHIVDDGWSFYWPNFRTTFSEAFKGWLLGNALAIAIAMLFLVAPFLEKPLLQLGVASFCLPSVAILPIFAIVWSGETPKIVLAAMAVFFTTLVGMLVGLKSADPRSLDLVHAYGGGVVAKLTKVRLRASLPSLFAGLRIAAPAAVLGAIIGEFIGGSTGLGVAMINSEQSLDIPRTWGIAVVAAATAGGAYALTSLAGRLLTPWAPQDDRR